MAMSASIALSSSSVKVNAQVLATVTVSNSGGTAVNMTSITPLANYTGGNLKDTMPINFGLPNLGPGEALSVPAGGTLKVTFGVVPFAPSSGFLGGSGTYDIGCVCNSADGSVFSPTAATLTVAQYS